MNPLAAFSGAYPVNRKPATHSHTTSNTGADNRPKGGQKAYPLLTEGGRHRDRMGGLAVPFVANCTGGQPRDGPPANQPPPNE
jgi:hypothetical protein